VARLYRRLYRQGRWFGLRSQPGETPGEFSEMLWLRIAIVCLPERPMKATARAHRERLISFITRDLHALTLLYERSLFSAEPLESQEKTSALDTWRSLRAHLRHVYCLRLWALCTLHG
jgi:hypothetical protein